MKNSKKFRCLTVFIIFGLAIKIVYADSAQLLCPNSPVLSSHSIQPIEISPYQLISPFHPKPCLYYSSCPTCPASSVQCLPGTYLSVPSTSPAVMEPQTLPPKQIKQCPQGTLLINGVCRLVYCGTQSIYREGKCLRIECAEGTYWNGSRCETTLETFVQKLTFNNTLTTYINRSSPPIVINNVNNITLNSTSTINDNNDEPEGPNKQPSCCTIITPRICKPKIAEDQKKWDCYSKRYRRCGGICVAPTVHLKAPYPSGNDAVTVLPPDNYLTDCRQLRTCPESNEMYDCSGCITGHPENCSRYCYGSICPSRRCQYYNQRDFCGQYPGEQGCLKEDGCYDDWCGGSI